MKRSGTIHTIHGLQTQGKSIREIARILGIARNTVRCYLRGKPEAVPHPKRGSVLDAYKAQICTWIQEDHLYNCETMLPRLQAQGYTGSLSTLNAFVHGLRPPKAGHYPVLCYETQPGEQMKYDWGEFHYEKDGKEHKLYGFATVLSYLRMRFITFVKRCDTPTMIRCLLEASEYFGGLPKAALADRIKSVFLEMEDKTPRWNPVFSDFMATLGVAPRVCKARTPQTKGKIERSVGIIKYGFWPGVRFTDIDDLNAQAVAWCDRINQRIHRTTRQVPLDRWVEEELAPLPKDDVWECFDTEERRVSWDGFIAYDGVLYGLPPASKVCGAVVRERERHHLLLVFSGGQRIATRTKRPQSQDIVYHPDQFRTVAPASAIKAVAKPLGHQVSPPEVERRSLAEYDRLFGLEAEVVG